MEKPVRGDTVKIGDRVGGRLVVQVVRDGECVTLHHPRGGRTEVDAGALVRVQRHVRVEHVPSDVSEADSSHVWYVGRRTPA